MRAHFLLFVSTAFLIACEPAPKPVGQVEPQPEDQNTLNTEPTLVEQPV